MNTLLNLVIALVVASTVVLFAVGPGRVGPAKF